MYIKFVICLESCCLWLHFMWIFTKIFHFFFSNIPPDRNKEIVMKIIMKKKERDFIILVHFFWEKKKIRIAYYFPPFHIFFMIVFKFITATACAAMPIANILVSSTCGFWQTNSNKNVNKIRNFEKLMFLII